jgi:DNA polymerase III sliding clamp (beta) subunit (PCNA family)
MLRKDLVNALEIVRPGLARNDLIPVMTHFWFTGQTLMTFNDQIAISVLCKTELTGAVPKPLLEFLRASRAKEVEFVTGENEIQVRAGRSKFKLGLLPKSDFVFEMPEKGNAPLLPVTFAEFRKAIEHCMMSVTIDTSEFIVRDPGICT